MNAGNKVMNNKMRHCVETLIIKHRQIVSLPVKDLSGNVDTEEEE